MGNGKGRRVNPGYDRKSYPTNGFASYSESILARCFVKEGLKSRYSPTYTWRTKREKEIIYRPDFVLSHPIQPMGIPWPVRFIEVKGVIHRGSLYKLRSMKHFHGLEGIFLTIEMFRYWHQYGMFTSSSTSPPPKENLSRVALRSLLYHKIEQKHVGYEKEIALSYHRKSCVVDISFSQPTYLPGVLRPIDYLQVIDDWEDISPTMVWIQNILQRREKKKILFFATRSYIDFWLGKDGW